MEKTEIVLHKFLILPLHGDDQLYALVALPLKKRASYTHWCEVGWVPKSKFTLRWQTDKSPHMAFHKYFTWHTKSEPQNLARNPYGRQVSDNRKEWESEVHINLVATSSILRFEDCLHSSFRLLRADRCFHQRTLSAQEWWFSFLSWDPGSFCYAYRMSEDWGTWAPKVWRMSLALQKVLKVKASGRKWKRGVMRDTTYITEIKMVRFMALNTKWLKVECFE